MKWVICLLVMSSPASAWEFSASPVCTLTGPATTVTYDATLPEYSIAIDRPEGWVQGPVFMIRYQGAASLTISTDQHQIDGTTLVVRDAGFGNVLNGMAQNTQFVAVLDGQSVLVSLDGIGPALKAFRACPAPATS